MKGHPMLPLGMFDGPSGLTKEEKSFRKWRRNDRASTMKMASAIGRSDIPTTMITFSFSVGFFKT